VEKTGILSRLYGHNLSLLTDLYQLTMGYGYWKNGMYDKESVFHLFYRKAPFKGRYAIACGLDLVMGYLENLRFEVDDIRYLGSLKGADGQALFDESFLNYLQRFEFRCDVEAIPEGTVCFPHSPILRIKGPLFQAQLIETALLNIINFSTLIATKAARICKAAHGGTVLEFGLRRAQGIDGALSSSRAAYIGGCHATSNVLAGQLFDIPVKGTHAHSWVMCFEEELEAFSAYAKSMPNNCVFLVDTYDTLEGVKKAIQVGVKLRANGNDLLGIRLDSGDLAQLSKDARVLLDEAGFRQTKIVASNDLDEHVIEDIRSQGAKIDVWGVGTKLVTAYDQAALGGVYKLASIKNENGQWEDRIKLSNHAFKTSNPGILQTKRLFKDQAPIADIIFDTKNSLDDSNSLTSRAFENDIPVNFKESGFDETASPQGRSHNIMIPVFKKGKRIYQSPNLHEMRKHCQSQISLFEKVNWETYHLGLEEKVWSKKLALIHQHHPVKS